jgi:hypothetical protein
MTAKKKAIEVVEPGKLEAHLGTRKLTLDPINKYKLSIELREVETTIPAGFQMEWGTVDVDGSLLEVTSGAGLGSGWACLHFKGKHYVIAVSDIVEAFLNKIEANK